MADQAKVVRADRAFGSYGGQTKRDYYANLLAELKSERSSFDSHWLDLANMVRPRRVRFTRSDRNKGDKRNQNIIDSTATFSLRTLQSGLHAGLTSPARPWMKLTTPDPELAENPVVKQWLHTTTQRMLTLFIQSNLYNVLPIIYGDIGLFGTSACAVLKDSHDLFRCYQFPVGSYVLGLDNRGIATTFAREYQLTVLQVIQEFALREDRTIDRTILSQTVLSAWDRGNINDPVDVTWVVAPNREADGSKLDAKYKPWTSCHFESGSGDGQRGGFLRESGYDSFPVLAPRWDVTSPEDTYGEDCPGMTALGDIRQLQSQEKSKGKAIHKMIDPPIVGPSALRNQETSLLPGRVTYVDVRDGNQGVRAIHDIPLNLEHLTADENLVRARIQRAFYEDLFLMLAQSDGVRGTQPITAEEVRERHEEKLLALGPVLERTNDELLDPLVDRVYSLMEAAGLVPDIPDELDGVKLKVEYISVMAQAQKLVAVAGQDRFLSTMVPLAQVFPGVREKINIFRFIDNYADGLGLDPRCVNADKDAQAKLDQVEQSQQAAAAAQTAQQFGQAIKSTGTTPMEGDTALNRIAPALAAAGGGV